MFILTDSFTPDTIENSVVSNGAAANDFVLEQAQAGRTVDGSTLTTARLASVTLVWEAGSQIDRVTVNKAISLDDPEDVAESVELESSEVAGGATDPGFVTGAGLQATGIGGATWQAGGCDTATGTRGKLTYCRHKYKIKDSNSTYDFYFYDRWATANGNSGTLQRDVPTKIDLRSRPKSTGSNINGMVDYAPRNAITRCNQVFSLTGGVSGFSASIPISECSEVAPYPNATTRTMRVVYDQGAVFSGRTHAVEFGVVFRTPQGKSANVAHYNYVKFCKLTYATCSTITKKQNGW